MTNHSPVPVGQCFYYENMGEVATVDQLLQEYVLCARDVKDPTLVHLVHQFLENKTGQVIVFTNKCRSAEGWWVGGHDFLKEFRVFP